MSWSIHPGDTILTTHRNIWQEINHRFNREHPLLDIKFIAPLFKRFGSGTVLLALNEGARGYVDAVLLERQGKGIWQLFLPSQAPLGPAIFGSARADGCKRCLDGLIGSLPGYGWLVGLQKQDPAYADLVLDCRDDQSELIEDANTLTVKLEGSFEDYWRARRKSLKANVRRAFRRVLDAGITHRLVELRGRRDMANAVAAHGMLEDKGWKGREGTAIRQDNTQGRFYTEMLENFGDVDGARVYQLYFDEQLAGSELAIIQNGMMVLLKTAYDEELAPYSPGRLLDYLVLERAFEDGAVHTVEFYTDAAIDDLPWSTSNRRLFHVNYFRSPLLRSLASATRPFRGIVKGLLRSPQAMLIVTFLGMLTGYTSHIHGLPI